jgi:hypothetical protein
MMWERTTPYATPKLCSMLLRHLPVWALGAPAIAPPLLMVLSRRGPAGRPIPPSPTSVHLLGHRMTSPSVLVAHPTNGLEWGQLYRRNCDAGKCKLHRSLFLYLLLCALCCPALLLSLWQFSLCNHLLPAVLHLCLDFHTLVFKQLLRFLHDRGQSGRKLTRLGSVPCHSGYYFIFLYVLSAFNSWSNLLIIKQV